MLSLSACKGAVLNCRSLSLQAQWEIPAIKIQLWTVPLSIFMNIIIRLAGTTASRTINTKRDVTLWKVIQPGNTTTITAALLLHSKTLTHHYKGNVFTCLRRARVRSLACAGGHRSSSAALRWRAAAAPPAQTFPLRFAASTAALTSAAQWKPNRSSPALKPCSSSIPSCFGYVSFNNRCFVCACCKLSQSVWVVVLFCVCVCGGVFTPLLCVCVCVWFFRAWWRGGRRQHHRRTRVVVDI